MIQTHHTPTLDKEPEYKIRNLHKTYITNAPINALEALYHLIIVQAHRTDLSEQSELFVR